MDKQIEVEFRGKLTKKEFDRVKSYLERTNELKSEKRRLTFMYFRDNIPKNINDIKDEKVDLRLRITNRQPELVLKYGLFNVGGAREELSIALDRQDVEKYIQLLALLGWNIGVIYATKIFIYKYQSAEIALVDIANFGYNFEIEILTDNTHVEIAQNKIKNIIAKLNLKVMSEREFKEQCNKINRNKELQFDFMIQKFSDFKSRFKEFY
jgi:adenylate cyclase class IV